jgi:hypothetical protein
MQGNLNHKSNSKTDNIITDEKVHRKMKSVSKY